MESTRFLYTTAAGVAATAQEDKLDSDDDSQVLDPDDADAGAQSPAASAEAA